MTLGKLVGRRYEIFAELERDGCTLIFLATDKHLPSNPYYVVKQLQVESLNPDTFTIANTFAKFMNW